MKSNPNHPAGGLSRALLLLLAAAVPLSAAEKTYRYFRFEPTMVRTRASAIQFSEFQFRLGGSPVSMAGVVVENPGGTNAVDAAEGAEKLIDGSVDTKWYSGAFSPIIFDFGTDVTIDGYTFATANDDNGRDPIVWTLSGSDDMTSWEPVDRREFYPTTTDRKTYVENFDLPDLPVIADFSAEEVIIANGDVSDLVWDVGQADSISISQGVGSVAGSGLTTVSPADDSDTLYTLTATNSAGTSTAEVTVRTIAGGSVNYRYIRFYPTKLRSNELANSVQLANLLFLHANGIDVVMPVAAQSLPGGNSNATEGPENLIDGDLGTKWLDFSKTSGVQLDLGEEAPAIMGYSLETANDAPTRDPVRWYMEGSNDPEGPWTLIENVTSFDFNTTTNRKAITEISLPGASLVPLGPSVESFEADSIAVSGSGVALSWDVKRADTVSISGIGAVSDSGSVVVYPTETTTYTLTAVGDGGLTATEDVEITVIPVLPNGIDYPTFDAAGDEFALYGAAAILVDPEIALPGGGERLRLTPRTNSQNGTAWERERVAVSEGFDAEFDMHVVSGGVGADGMSFMIQNHPLGTLATPATHELGLAENSLNISFDGFQNAGDPGDPSNAVLRVLNGGTVLQTVDLTTVAGLELGVGADLPRLGKVPDGESVPTPYQVRVAYLPGNLNVYMDGIAVVTGLAITLEDCGAVHSDGKSWMGFAARTGGLAESHDVTRWVVTEGPPTISGGGLQLLDYSINFATSEITLVWRSDASTTYRIASSPDLQDWSTRLEEGIAGVAGQTSRTVAFTPGTKLFIRVEEE
ncbi:discoidin domain-containing protein [Haloferula sargassicola]|uniref:F5/8 type C domain-containing protein n=1 Tax=Haloferula sargassicola TaxID=490096 RepID=A0ABP9UNU9_9BACT